MSKNALIISLNPRVAHVSHLLASYAQMRDLGYKPICYIHPDIVRFFPKDIEYITELKHAPKIDVAIFWFPSIKNLNAMICLKTKHKSRILYVYHEPRESFKNYIDAGNTKYEILKIFLKYYVGLSFLKLADIVLLPSYKAIDLYNRDICHKVNANYSYLPLMYCDETIEGRSGSKRKYISYIGGISKDHAYGEFVNFILKISENSALKNIQFLIATRDSIELNDSLKQLHAKGKLRIIQGRPMTNNEINECYASSWFVWNAYNRSTQSGVLAKAFMFGTPAIVMKKNLSEFVENGKEVIAVDDNSDYKQLSSAAKELIKNHDFYSKNARANFEKNYIYSAHNKTMTEIIQQ